MSRRGRLETDPSEASFDLSVGDLMSGLLAVFILALAAAALAMGTTAETYGKVRSQLADVFSREFEGDLLRWNAEFDPSTLTFRFRDAGVLFEPDRDVLRDGFKKTLEEFFPKFVGIIMREDFRNEIDEVRVEGHTARIDVHPYMSHMLLSQSRASNVLAYCLSIGSIAADDQIREWLSRSVLATGFAYARPIMVSGAPDWDLSRRVEFRVRTNAEKWINELTIEARPVRGNR